MKPVIAPINTGDQGDVVANLQSALLFLIDHSIFQVLDAPNYPTIEELKELIQALRNENERLFFGEATTKLIQIFQIQQGLGDNLRGVAEEKTAALLNKFLSSLGAFDNAENSYWVKGIILKANRMSFEGLTVRAFDKDLRIEEMLGEAVTDEKGYYEIGYTVQKSGESESNSADIFVSVFDPAGKLLSTSDIFFNAPAEQTINLTIFPGNEGQSSEWENIDAQLLPLLKKQKKALFPK